MAQVIAEIKVCTDCLLVHANGETGTENPDREPWGLLPAAQVAMNCETDADGNETCGFEDWNDCDACGTSLAGDRHRMAVFAWGAAA